MHSIDLAWRRFPYRYNQPKVHDTAQPDAVVLHDHGDVAEADFSLGGIAALISLQTGSNVFAFILFEPVSLFGASSRLVNVHGVLDKCLDGILTMTGKRRRK